VLGLRLNFDLAETSVFGPVVRPRLNGGLQFEVCQLPRIVKGVGVLRRGSLTMPGLHDVIRDDQHPPPSPQLLLLRSTTPFP
jgi:hypothetical protein